MCAALLLDPGFHVKPLIGTGPAGHLATVSSVLVFEDFRDALQHLDALTVHLELGEVVLEVAPRPVRAHVPGTLSPTRPIGYRLASRDAGAAELVAHQVAALNAAAACLGMTGLEALDPLAG